MTRIWARRPIGIIVMAGYSRAFKDMMVQGITMAFLLNVPLNNPQLLLNLGVAHDDAAIWGHFPKLRGLALAAIKSRQGMSAYNLLKQDSFMQEWDTDMRYAKTASVTPDRAEKWRKNADCALGLLL